MCRENHKKLGIHAPNEIKRKTILRLALLVCKLKLSNVDLEMLSELIYLSFLFAQLTKQTLHCQSVGDVLQKSARLNSNILISY